MEFRVLGSLQVLGADGEVPVGGGKLRALLGVLLVHANKPVSEDALIEALWGEGASKKAADNLHVLVSRLRRSLGSDRIVRDGGGYRVRVEEDELDLGRFERLRAEGRFRDALDLWRGPPLADFAYEGWAQNEIRRLDELRLLVVEERFDADLGSGLHAELVGELQALVAEHPLREEFRRQLLLSLYRSGRQAEALEAYRSAARMLDEELGLEPSPALRDLERAVLRQDPELDAPPRLQTLLVGRTRRRGALAAVAAAVLAFGGAAAAFALTDRGESDRRASAAPLPATTTTKATERVRRLEPAVTTRVVVIRERPEPKAPPARSRTVTSPAPQPAPPPPSPAKQETTPRVRPRSIPAAPAAPQPQPKQVPIRISDNFDDGIRNGTIWHQIVTGTGVALAERNGRLEIEFTPDAIGGGEFDILGAHYGTQCRFVGDFDARVDYELLEWPATNGVLVQMNAWFTKGPSLSIARQSQKWDEEYASFGPRGNNRPTIDPAGSLRIRRVGNTLSAHYKSGREWLSLGSLRSTGAPMIAIQAYSTNEWFGDRPVRVAFDNFVMTAAQPVC